MPSLADSVGKELRNILLFIALIWAVFFASLAWPELNEYGLQPREVEGLTGIVTMPFLHASLSHLVSNTLPLAFLLFLLAGSRPGWWKIVVELILVSGLLLWVFGRSGGHDSVPMIHIGASGLVSGLITFLVFGGLWERRLIPVIVAVVTVLLYGGSLLWGLIPRDSAVSWDGHFCGAAAGGLVAAEVARRGGAEKRRGEKRKLAPVKKGR